MASPELEAIVAQMRAQPFNPDAPLGDLRQGMDMMGQAFELPQGVTLEAETLGGVPAERLSAGWGGPCVLLFHGGGYVLGSPRSHRHMAARLAADLGGEVHVLDYRLSPEHPFPAPIEDALGAYRELLSARGGAPVALVGDSAGGNLVFACALAIREAGLAAPSALVGVSPWVNMETTDASYETLAKADPLLSRGAIDFFARTYLAGAPARDPRASPLFADLQGLSRTLIQIGDREVFLGDAVRMHEALIAAGVDTELKVWKEMFHVWHLYWPMLPQGAAAIAEIAAFIKG